MRITRGQRFKLDAHTQSREFFVGVHLDTPLVIDVCCFGLDADGKLSDDRYFVFYNQTSSPEGALSLQATPANGLDQSRFHVLLDRLPQTVRRLVFTASIDAQTGQRGTMSSLRFGYLRLSDTSGELGRYEFSGRDFSNEGALMLGEIYWKDAWRFWAVGQGFTGDLGALLKHFGGVAIEDSAAPSPSPPAPPTRTAPPSPTASPTPTAPPTFSPPPPTFSPSTPISAPTPLVSVPVATPVSTAPTQTQTLQALLDATPEGGTLQLPRGEYAGPVSIRRSVTVVAPGAVVWSHNGPVVTIVAPNVTLRELEIEVTAPDSPDHDIALRVEGSVSPQMQDVCVRGRVVGAGEGDWALPDSVQLGDFAARAANVYELSLQVPIACELKCTIAGVSLEPSRVEAGAHTVTMTVRDVPADTFLSGRLEARADGFVRAVSLSGRAVQGAQAAQNRRL